MSPVQTSSSKIYGAFPPKTAKKWISLPLINASGKQSCNSFKEAFTQFWILYRHENFVSVQAAPKKRKKMNKSLRQKNFRMNPLQKRSETVFHCACKHRRTLVPRQSIHLLVILCAAVNVSSECRWGGSTAAITNVSGVFFTWKRLKLSLVEQREETSSLLHLDPPPPPPHLPAVCLRRLQPTLRAMQ